MNITRCEPQLVWGKLLGRCFMQICVCEETLAAHQARLGELKGLVAQITADVGLEAGGVLGDEVEALGKKLEDVRESLATLAEVAESRELCGDELLRTKTFLSSVQQSLSAVEDSNEKDTENQLTALRTHLLALGKTEGQLQSLKEKSLELGPVRPETSVVEILQLWQQVFRETFQQYHRLSARLVKSQDGAAALRLWQEYLLHVQSFLSGSIPEDYHSLTEHQHLCEVHQNLLTSQQSVLLSKSSGPDGQLGRGLVETSVVEQFNSLTNLHNETLARIMERHEEVRERICSWDRYRADQARLLAWLKDTERERNRLQLRYIHVRRIPKVQARIQTLLEQVPVGEAQANSLQQQQGKLLHFCDDALATSIRMEHAAISQRISNLQAGLETWKDFLDRITGLTQSYDTQVSGVQAVFREVHAAVADPGGLPTSHTGMQNKLEVIRQLRSRLVELTTDLEGVGVTQEQLKECVSPMDMKSISQKVWILWQTQGDLDHQLSLLSHQLEEKLGLRLMFDTRQSRFLVWAGDVESRLDSSSSGDPEEVLRRLETELQAEVSLKRREVDWLLTTGQELIEVCPEEKGGIADKIQQVQEAWRRLQGLGEVRANRLHHILQTKSQLELRLAELRAWLHQVETQLSAPLVLESCTKEAVDNKLEQHQELQKTIEGQSGNIADVLNLCELFLTDCDNCKATINTESLITAIDALERSDLGSQDEVLSLVSRVEGVIQEVKARSPALQILDKSYSKLAKESGLEIKNLQQLTSLVRTTLQRWHALTPTAIGILQRLQRELQVYRDFVLAHGKAVVTLTQVDVQLTQIQHLSTPEQAAMPRSRLQQIEQLDRELESHGGLLQTADELGLEVLKRSKPEELPGIQEMIDEYQLLWKDIRFRISDLKTQCRAELAKKEERTRAQQTPEVDESIQVETLRFEQDSAVQVDTLPPLMRLTSRDAYLYELETALQECGVNLDILEEVLRAPTPEQGGTPALPPQNMSKVVASCESSVELIRHLNTLLVEESGLSDEQAKTREVQRLSVRFDELLARARQREQRLRDVSDSARLTCPLCSRRNWQQLDNDLWRLEQWLQFAEGTQSSQRAPPTNIEQLEDVIQDHREFLMDLDSHKSIVVSLNIVGTHLADHTEDTGRAEQLRARLVTTNSRWDAVCRSAAAWQTQLQTALMENDEFHQIIEELVEWLEKTENTIRMSEPELKGDLERCEPRVMSLQEAADQLLRHSEAPEGSTTTWSRLTDLRLKLQSLRRLTGVYVLKLGAVLGRDPSELGMTVSASGRSTTATSLASLSHELLDQAAVGHLEGSAHSDQQHSNEPDEMDTTVLARGYRFLGRVVRASLPIQALMLLLLGVASLVPMGEDDYLCNTFARSFEPILRYRHGPPPV
uniref:KASH domain-containing protein n=1 Tax=Timema monikensis TaxID=170555 RepID=A0A7R9EFL4_9NEOP|nr:unnamed protein product [Timema monikensis]